MGEPESNNFIRMLHKRATIVANPGRYSLHWGRRLETDFKKVLLYFENSRLEEQGRFEDGSASAHRLPELRYWLRIMFV